MGNNNSLLSYQDLLNNTHLNKKYLNIIIDKYKDNIINDTKKIINQYHNNDIYPILWLNNDLQILMIYELIICNESQNKNYPKDRQITQFDYDIFIKDFFIISNNYGINYNIFLDVLSKFKPRIQIN